MRKDPTITSLVEAELRERDDFMNVRQLMAAAGANHNQVTAALYELRKYRVVDVIIQPDGIGWWYALPPQNDTRQRVILLRKTETTARRQRRRKEKE